MRRLDLRQTLGRARAAMALPAADHIVCNDAQWAAVAAMSASALSGKIVEIQGSAFAAQLVMAAKAMTAPLTIRGAAGNLVPSLKFTAMQKLTVRDLNLQMPGWPASYGGCLEFFGANADIKIDGVCFRHGYGPGQIDLTPAVIEAAPEILRTDNLITATSTPTRIAVVKSPADGPNWWIEFFNRGSNAVYVRGGDGAVVAGPADTLVAAGGYVRLSASHSHVAVLAVAGSSLCNARAEVGLSSYVADAFNCDGGTTIQNLEIVNCSFDSVGNGVKAMSNLITGRLDIWKNRFALVYMDLISVGQAHQDCTTSILLNSGMTPSARSGIAENLTGDARDPHGDLHQSYYNPNLRSTGGWYIAGNVYWPSGRVGATAQGNFISDNDGGYENVTSIANILSGGAGRGISVGDSGQAASGYVYGDGDICINPASAASGSSIYIYGATGLNNSVQRSIAAGFPLPATALLAGNITLGAANTGIFANWPGAASATSKQQMMAALTTGQGVGAADLYAQLIDEGASSPDGVIRWANTRPGLSWPIVSDQPAGMPYSSPLRRVLGGGSGMAISAFPGTQMQISSDAVGAVILTPWSALPGQVSRGQFVQVRGTTAAFAGGDAGLGVTISGITHPAQVTTEEAYFTLAADMGFADPALTSFSPGTPALTLLFKLRDPALAGFTLFQILHRNTSLDVVNVTGGGDLRSLITDGANLVVKPQAVVAANVIQANTVHEILYSMDLGTRVARLWVDGIPVATTALTANSGLFGSTQSRLHLLQSTSGGSRFSGQVFRVKVWKDIAIEVPIPPTSVPFKELTGSALAANADLWRQGKGVAL